MAKLPTVEDKLMNVKELKEILNGLPDDAQVIVSEKFGRGGHIQDYCIGELVDDYRVEGKHSDKETLRLLKSFEQHKFEDDLGVAELEAGTAIREEFISDDGRELVVWKSKDGTPFQYFNKGDEWDKEKMIRIFKYNSEKDAEHIEDLKKELNKPLKKVNAIELSCDF